MFSGLRNAIRHVGTSVRGSVKSTSSQDLDKLLEEDVRKRKQQLSKFNWYQEKIKTRQAAESKLQQSAGQQRLLQQLTKAVVCLNL